MAQLSHNRSELVVVSAAAQELAGYKTDGAVDLEDHVDSRRDKRLQSVDGASEHGELMSASFFDEEEG